MIVIIIYIIITIIVIIVINIIINIILILLLLLLLLLLLSRLEITEFVVIELSDAGKSCKKHTNIYCVIFLYFKVYIFYE